MLASKRWGVTAGKGEKSQEWFAQEEKRVKRSDSPQKDLEKELKLFCWMPPSLERKARGQTDALQKGLNVQPAVPERFPAGRTIPRAAKIATLSSDEMPTLQGRKRGRRHLGQIGDYLDYLVGHGLTGRQFWTQTRCRTQL
jgi:hypothetical protein